jgi:hypothetical protein
VEDVVRVPEHGAADVGEHQAAPLSLEQLLIQRGLQRLDLVGDGGLRQAQLAARLGDAARPGRGPEVEEVVVVEPVHAFRIP